MSGKLIRSDIIEELLATFTSPALDIGTRQMSSLGDPEKSTDESTVLV